jgi:hypothetical protein
LDIDIEPSRSEQSFRATHGKRHINIENVYEEMIGHVGCFPF